MPVPPEKSGEKNYYPPWAFMLNDSGDAIRTHSIKILHPTPIRDIFLIATITTCNTGSLTRRTSIEVVIIASNIVIVRAKNDRDMVLSVSGLGRMRCLCNRSVSSPPLPTIVGKPIRENQRKNSPSLPQAWRSAQTFVPLYRQRV